MYSKQFDKLFRYRYMSILSYCRTHRVNWQPFGDWEAEEKGSDKGKGRLVDYGKTDFGQDAASSVEEEAIFVQSRVRDLDPVRIFLQRVSRGAVLAVVNPSVRLSVTRWHCAKTTQATIMGSSLEDSPMTLVSSRLTCAAKFQREHRERGRRMRVG